MKDKSSLQSLEDMPDDRWVIAVLGLVQISEGKMNQQDEDDLNEAIKKGTKAWKNVPDTFVEDLRGDSESGCDAEMRYWEGHAAGRQENIGERIYAEGLIEPLQREVARLEELVAMQAEAIKANAIKPGFSDMLEAWAVIALSATSETVSAYQNEVKAKVWEELLKKYAIFNSEEYAWLSNSILDDISELRAKGE